jgi:hypothetical protein
MPPNAIATTHAKIATAVIHRAGRSCPGWRQERVDAN